MDVVAINVQAEMALVETRNFAAVVVAAVVVGVVLEAMADLWY